MAEQENNVSGSCGGWKIATLTHAVAQTGALLHGVVAKLDGKPGQGPYLEYGHM